MNAAQHILILGVRLYQLAVSPALKVVFGPLARCRFEPSCSAYAIEAFRTHGALVGGLLALKRIGRCQPWGPCGHDPVPPGVSPGKPKIEERTVVSQAIESHAVH